jgi:Fe-S cluster assembly ATPase SufC
MVQGRIARSGGPELAEALEARGYEDYRNEPVTAKA